MAFNSQIVGCKYLEATESAVRHVNVHVHPTGPKQSWIQFVLMVSSEHYDPLIPATRPQSVN
uniref:Uncharacterized protein n=1 Tax=Kalanchoe fedtschenkoi TaxID=63787 RepID=A0A7N0V101_KALFE